jgi:hypothetical protein
MARAQKLKVYRTPIGFHDAYVAAPSQKAALEAWGSDANLFARGLAEIVTDDALTREPLQQPGKIIKRLRGSEDEHLAALPADVPKPHRSESKSGSSSQPTGRAASRKPSPAKPKRKPKPRPSRGTLEAAERDLEALEKRQKEENQALRDREQELQRERRDLERTQDRDRATAEEKIEQERRKHSEALDRWIEDQK